MNHYIKYAVLLLVSLLCSNCSKIDEPNYSIDKISGFVQKGPYVNGTAISIAELNTNLNPTGKTFSSQIVDNKGLFEVREITLNSKYVEIRADGFYFDEVKGEKSAAQLTLFGLADVSDNTTINVNMMTQLEKGRAEYLIGQGLKFEEAKKQAQTEVMAAFGINYEGMTDSETLDISQQDEKNAILLAISVLLQGNRSVGDLTELIANFSTDLREDGILNSDILKSELFNQAQELNLPQIRSNLKRRYEELGVQANIPDFEKYIHQFISGENPFEIVFTINHVSCNGLSDAAIDLSVSGGTEPYTYSWSNTETSEDIANLAAGMYTVTITDQDGFSYDSAIEVSEPEPLMVSEVITNSTLGGSDGGIDITVSGGTAPYVFLWSNGMTSEDLADLPAGTYNGTITDENGCSIESECRVYESFVDAANGDEYKTVQIGSHTWMAENLRATHYNDGTDIPLVSDAEAWSTQVSPGYCWNNNDISWADEYGAIYNWYTVATGEICPSGWHVPSDAEWSELISFVTEQMSPVDASTALRSTSGWGEGHEGIDAYAFNVIPVAVRSDIGEFHMEGGNFWTSTEYEGFTAWIYVFNDTKEANRIFGDNKIHGFSVRCVKDE